MTPGCDPVFNTMKTNGEIATILLSGPAIIAPRALHESLGHDAFREALRIGWVIPDTETGALHINISRRLAMEAAAKEVAQPVVESVAQGLPGHEFFGGQAGRGYTVVEALPPLPGAPTLPGAASKDAEIGDQVVVAEGGKTYSAKVQAKNADGSYKLSFGSEKPPRDTFKRDEVRVSSKADPAIP